MSSKKTSKTIPEQKAKRYIAFLVNIYSPAGPPSQIFFGAFSTKDELNKRISNVMEEDLEDHEIEVYDVVNHKWSTLTLEVGKVKVNWL